jgi:hypothetical protein
MKPALSSCAPGSRHPAGVGLIDCLVYISLLMILLELAFAAFYRTIHQSTHLNRNTSDLIRALWAGERWREDVRLATAPPRFAGEERRDTLILRHAKADIIYRFTNDVVLRQEFRGPTEELLTGVSSSSFHQDRRRHVTGWRWELELQKQKEVTRVSPMLTFQAVASAASPP